MLCREGECFPKRFARATDLHKWLLKILDSAYFCLLRGGLSGLSALQELLLVISFPSQLNELLYITAGVWRKDYKRLYNYKKKKNCRKTFTQFRSLIAAWEAEMCEEMSGD